MFFFFYKRCTVRRKPVIYGKMNGVTKLFLAVKIVEVLNKDYADPDGCFIILDIKTADMFYAC